MSKKLVLFDFDGTIADTMLTLITGYNKLVAKTLNCKLVDTSLIEEYKKWTPRALMKEHRITVLKLPVLAYWLRRYLRNHFDEVNMFTDVDQVIKKLKDDGFKLGILTSNSRRNVKTFLSSRSLLPYFDYIYSSKKLTGKDQVFKKMQSVHDLDINNVIYIGDEVRDIEFVRKIGIPIIAVTWGLGNRELLSSHQPDFMIDDPKEILPIVEEVFS